MHAAVAAQNAAGGVDGRQLVLVTADDQSNPVQAATAARGLVSNNVFGIVTEGQNDSPMYPYLQQNNVPVMEANGIDSAYLTDRNAFAPAGIALAPYVSTSTAKFLQSKGVTNLAILAHSVPASAAGGRVQVGAAKSVGIKTGLELNNVPFTSSDLTADALQMKRLGIDGIYAPVANQAAVSIATAVKQQGVPIKAMVLASIYDPAYLKVPALAGAWTNSPSVPLSSTSSPAVQKYTSALAKYSPGTDPYEQFALYGYEDVQLMVYGLQHAGACPTRSSFINNLRAVNSYDEGGLLLSPQSFTPGLTPNGSPSSLCAWFVQIQPSGFVPNPGMTCGTYIKAGS
jgi:ABC-type branched-subunit amino acid transport system substrate-binding protein